jgi:hypothetical protein
MSNNPVASGGVYSAIAQMQPQFQFTNMPVASESNYGFVYQYIGNAGTYEPNMFYRCVYNSYAGEYRWEEVIFHATVTVDSELSSTSTNPVQNKVVKEALDTKQDIMQFTTMPSAQDNLGRIVQYTGATNANYQNGCFYKAVYDSEHDVYVWNIVRFSADISVDNVLSDVSENPVQNKVITQKFDEYKTTFTGTEEEWNALTSEEQNVYDIINITNDGDVLNLGVYLEKKTAMPVASEDVENKIYLYTGTTTQDFKKGVVYQCVSDGQDPATYSWVALIDFGTAAIKNSTDRVSPNNTDLVESQSVYSAINNALSSIYTPRGDITCAELTSSLLISDNIGNVYEVSDSGTTTALFLQGAGKPIAIGDNVGIINAGQGRILFNLMANAFDLTDYQKKDLASTIEGATTVEGALGALSTDKQSKDLATTVESATTVEGALGALSDNKQAKTLTTSVESQTTVEGALGALSTNKATQAEVNDIVNVLGAKNLFDGSIVTTTAKGVTFTQNADGTISVTGSNTQGSGIGVFAKSIQRLKAGSYILSGCPSPTSGGLHIQLSDSDLNVLIAEAYDGNEASFTLNEDTNCKVMYWGSSNLAITGTLTISPMIRLASDPDNTYQPYAMTNQQLTAENEALTNNINVNGSKNVLASLTPSGTYLGITISRNESGDIVVNGTATASPTTISLFDRTFKHIGEATILKFTDLGIDKTKKYVFSRAEKVSNFRYNIRVMNGTTQVAEIELGNNDGLYTVIDFSQYTCDGLKADIVVANGTTITNKVFSAMLCLESDYDLDPTYQPYAKTNRELTKKIDIVGNLFTTTTKVVDNITHGIATTVATLENLPIGTYVVSGQFNSDNAMSGGGLVQFASSGVIQNGASCSTIINQGFKANAGLTGIFNVTNATNQINLQIYTANADLTVSSARLAAIRIA